MFREFVEEHGDLTQGQMAQLWGEKVTQRNISKALRQLGISRKKTQTAIKKETKLNVKNFKKD